MNTGKNRELTGRPLPASEPRGNVLLASGESFWKYWLDWLRESGILGPEEMVRRIVIEITIDDDVRVFVERLASEEMLAVRPPRIVLINRPARSGEDTPADVVADILNDEPDAVRGDDHTDRRAARSE